MTIRAALVDRTRTFSSQGPPEGEATGFGQIVQAKTAIEESEARDTRLRSDLIEDHLSALNGTEQAGQGLLRILVLYKGKAIFVENGFQNGGQLIF